MLEWANSSITYIISKHYNVKNIQTDLNTMGLANTFYKVLHPTQSVPKTTSPKKFKKKGLSSSLIKIVSC
jgi:hypothetical protein